MLHYAARWYEDAPGRAVLAQGQISYDLRSLRANQIIERTPDARSYQVNSGGPSVTLFFARLIVRVLIPAFSYSGPPPGTSLRQANRAFRRAVADLATGLPASES